MTRNPVAAEPVEAKAVRTFHLHLRQEILELAEKLGLQLPV